MKQKYYKYKLLIPAMVLVGIFVFSKPLQVQIFDEKSDARLSEADTKSGRLVAKSPNSISPGSATSKGDENTTPKASDLIEGVVQKRYYLSNIPNDPYYSSAWYLQSVNAPSSWATTTGSSDITVANIDTGFALSHQDLVDHWKYNQAEFGGGKESDGIDNDSNGYVDDYRGWDFTASGLGDNNPQAGTINPNGIGTSHGTETAGLVGAAGDNGIGTTAVSQNVSIIPLQVIDDNGLGWSDAVANAIIYAVDQNVDVINMSLGTSGDDPIVRQAVDYAYDNNVVVVAAAGNCGNTGTGGVCTGNPTGFITFPASYNRVIAVGATTSTNARASFSSYGQRLDVVAPGSGTIVSPTWTSGNGTSAYASTLYGTSYSSPIVASSVALIRSIRPSSSVDDVRALIMAGASKLGGMGGSFYSTSYGHGILDVNKAISISSDLKLSTEKVPELAQAGGVSAEHTYSTNDTIGSGCEIDPGLWCTVWFRDSATNNERYLPYTKVGVSRKTGWNFNSGVLDSGYWEVRARDGSAVSDTPYTLFRK
ncbi:S8 family serine peptidase [Candidatus Nomurabacteria bacterium]|nr:S8 family serine peptidase [Candidatus Nomurabacteria bacterium]